MEAGILPIHVRVEAEITKGKYAGYSAFAGREAAEYLHPILRSVEEVACILFIALRWGFLQRRSQILLHSSVMSAAEPRSISSKQIRKIVHGLYERAGLIKKPQGRMCELRTHSLWKLFKTQLVAAGIQADVADYLMCHVTDTYLQLESFGVEWLRNVYASSNLSIRPKTTLSKIEKIGDYIRGLGMNPETILTREAQSMPARTFVNEIERDGHMLGVLEETLRSLLIEEVEKQVDLTLQSGGPAGI